MKKNTYSVILTAAAIISTVFSGILGGAAAAADIKPRTMVFHYAGPLDCTNARFANNFKELVEKKSGGKLKVDVF